VIGESVWVFHGAGFEGVWGRKWVADRSQEGLVRDVEDGVIEAPPSVRRGGIWVLRAMEVGQIATFGGSIIAQTSRRAPGARRA